MRISVTILVAALAACTKSSSTPATTPEPTPVVTCPAPEAAPPGVREAGPLVGILARFKPLPGKEEEANAFFRDVAAKVQAEEPGVLLYLFMRGRTDPKEIVVFEVYEDAAARQSHVDSAIMKAARPRLPELIDVKSIQLEWGNESFAGFLRR